MDTYETQFAIFNHLFANRRRKSANCEIKLHKLSVVTKQTVKITHENRMLFLRSLEMIKAHNVFSQFSTLLETLRAQPTNRKICIIGRVINVPEIYASIVRH